jgi:hypothetical protein
LEKRFSFQAHQRKKKEKRMKQRIARNLQLKRDMYGGGGEVPPGLLLPLGGELVVVEEAAEKEEEREVVEREVVEREEKEEEGEEEGGKKGGKKEDDADEESSMLSTMTPVWVRCFDPCFKRFGWYTTLFNNSNAVHPTPDFDFFKPKGDWMQKYRAVSPWLYSVDKRGKPIDPSTLASLAPTHPIWPVSERPWCNGVFNSVFFNSVFFNSVFNSVFNGVFNSVFFNSVFFNSVVPSMA